MMELGARTAMRYRGMAAMSLAALLSAALLCGGCHGGDSSAKPGSQGASASGQQSKTNGSDKGSKGADTSGKSGGGSSGGGDSGGSSGAGGSGGSSDSGVPAGTVTIAPENLARAGIRTGPVEVRRMARQLSVAGQVTTDEKHTDHIGARADGVVERVLVLPGDTVRAGQTLAWLHSHSVHETVGALAQAFAAEDRQTSGVRFSEINRERYQHLLDLQVASQEEAQRANQQLKQSQQDLADAQANVHTEREHLSELLQVSPASLTPSTLYNRELVPLRAVSGGTVLQRDVTPGQVILTGQQAFVVSNLHTVWVTAALNEKDLARVRRGAHVTVTTQGYEGVNFGGTVAVVGDQLDPQTRTVPVRVVVPNPGTKLRPGMFATANIDETATRDGIYVPEGAVQEVNGLEVVFVTSDNKHFSVRAIKLGEHSKGMVEATEGLTPNDHVVTDGAFMVKGELLKGSVGEG